jgi:hypothetical protein
MKEWRVEIPICGLWLVALETYFLFLGLALLPEDSHYIGSSLEAIRSAVPGLERWLGHVFSVMGGFMVATGAIMMLVACRLLARRERGTLTALSVAGAASAPVACRPDLLPAGRRRFTNHRERARKATHVRRR